MAYDFDIQAWFATVNQAAIMQYELGSYIRPESYVTYSTAGINTDQIPKIVNREAANSEDTSEMVPVTESEQSITINLDTPLKRHQFIAKEQINRVGMQYAAKVGEKLGLAVAEGMSHRIAALMGITSLEGSNIVSFDDESTNLSDFVEAAEEAHALLDDDKVQGHRFAFAKPSYFRKLAQTNYYGSKDFRSSADNANQFNTFTAMNTTWVAWPSPIWGTNLSADTKYPTKYRRDFSADRLQALIYSADAFAVKLVEGLNTEMNYVPERRSFLITSAAQFGTAAQHSEGIAAIVGDVGSS